MRSPLQLGARGRHDPWWDLEGRTVRRRRRHRVALDVSILVVTLVVLAGVLWIRPVRAAATVNLDQWASSDLAWQNGNLNGNNSRYPEGGIVPFRLAMEGLKAGDHQIHINYDFTAGGHKAYDFLATWNVTNAGGRICAASGGAISSMCPSMPASSSFAFPSDNALVDGLRVRSAEAYSAAPRRLTIWGGTITSISGPVHSGSTDGNSTADFLVRFRSTGSAVLLAWGGHLAQSAFWNRSAGGPSDGAGQVSGAPWHMRSLQLDGAGNKNQDRSIQPSAIVGELPPFALAPPTPAPRPTTPPAAPAPTPPPGGGTPGGGTPGGGTPGGGTPGGGSPNSPSGGFPTVPPTTTDAGSRSSMTPIEIGRAAVFLAVSVLPFLIAVAAVGRSRRRTWRPRG